MAENSFDFEENNEERFDIRKVFQLYLRFWYWFIISIFFSLGGAYIYLRYTTPIYSISSVLLIKDEKKGIGGNDMLKELEMFSGNKIVENELEVLKSRTLIEKVVDDLNLTVAYYQKGEVRPYDEIFRNSPIWVQHGNLNEIAYKEPVFIKIVNKQKFELQTNSGDVLGVFAYSQNIRSQYGAFRVFLNDSLYRKDNDLIRIKFFEKNALVEQYQKDIKVELLNQKSTVIKLTLESALQRKGKAILSKLLEAYTFNALADKNM